MGEDSDRARGASGFSKRALGVAAGVALVAVAVVGAGLYFFLRPTGLPSEEVVSSLDLDDTALHRPSPLPYFVHDGASWHQRLIGLPEGDLDLKFLDALVPGDDLPLAITREYRSNLKAAGVFGTGWTSNLDTRVEPRADGLSVREADGRVNAYVRSGQDYVPVLPGTLSNVLSRSRDGSFERRWRNGKVEHFDRAGRLASVRLGSRALRLHYPDARLAPADWIADSVGHKLVLSYREGRLVRIDEPENRHLSYDYADGRLSRTTDAIGRTVSFQYENGRLSRVALPDGQALVVRYAKTGQVASLEGPGSLRTSFAWKKLPDASGTELVATLGDGERETTRFEARPFRYADWGVSANFAGLAEGSVGLDIVRTDAGGGAIHLFQIGDRLLLKQEGTAGSTGVDPAGVVQRFGGDRGSELLRAADIRGAIASIDPGALWRSRVPPGLIGAHMKGAKYDASGRAVEIRGDASVLERWVWDNADRVSDWTSADGVTTHYDYDAMDRVTKVTVNGVAIAAAQYNAMGLVSRIAGGHGVTSYGYDAAGHLVAIARPDGSSVQYVRDRVGRIKVIAVNGRPTTGISYDNAGRITRLASVGGPTSTYAYDTHGRVVREDDGEGDVVSYIYDDKGRVAETRDGAGTRTVFKYGDGTVSTLSTFADGHTTSQTIDPRQRTISVKGRDGRVVTVHYDGNGQPASVADSASAGAKYVYDAQSRLQSIAYPGGVSRAYSYDAKGRITQIATGDQVFSIDYEGDGGWTLRDKRAGIERSQSYDAHGALVSRTDETGKATKYAYDAKGRLATVTASDGTRLVYRYDESGRIAAVETAAGGSTAALEMSYDAAGRPLAITHEDSTREEFVYDAKGRVVGKTNRQGQKFTYAYDAMGRLASVASPAGTLVQKFDSAGRIVERQDPVEGTYLFAYGPGHIDIIDPAGARTRFGFDAKGRLVSTLDAVGGRTSREYDAAGRPASITDARGQRSTWTYAADGRAVDYTSALGKVTRDAFDAAGRLVKQSYPGNRSLDVSYGADGRISRLAASDGNSWTYVYGDDGRVAALDGPEGRSQYRYDGAGRMLAYTSPAGETVAYTYDSAGRLSTMKTPKLGLVRYRYDAFGRVAAIAGAGGETAYAYDAAGRPATIAYPGGMKLAYAYDAGLRIASITLTSADGATLYAEKYTYDPRGNVATLSDPEGTKTFQYDALNRIVDVANPDGTHETFAYDAVGNIVRHDGETASFDADGALVSRGDRRVVPDANGDDCGDLRESAATTGQCKISYDALGRISRVAVAEGTRTYAWDGAAQLLGIHGPGIDEHYLYSDGELVEDADSASNTLRVYTPGLIAGEWSSVSVNGRKLFPVWSANGTLRLLVDENGKVAARYRSGLYGELKSVDGDAAVPFVFAGGRLDSAINAYRFGTRYLGPDGRFLSPDPAGPDKDGNLYSYALDNPLRFKDTAGASGTPVTYSWTEFVPVGRNGVTIARPFSITVPAPTPLSQLPYRTATPLPENMAPLPSWNLKPAVYGPWNGDPKVSRQVLADIALHDPNPVVRAAAQDTLKTLAAKKTAISVQPVKLDVNGVPDVYVRGEAHLGSDQVTLFERGINSELLPREVPAVRSASILAHEAEHASVQQAESAATPYTTRHEWEAFYKQTKIEAWSAEGTQAPIYDSQGNLNRYTGGIINPDNPMDPTSVLGNLETNSGYARARQGETALRASDPTYAGYQEQMYRDLGNDIRRGREITVAGQEVTVTKGGNLTIDTARGVNYDVKTGQVVELTPSGEPLSVTNQVDRLQALRAEGNKTATLEVPDFEAAANVGNKTATMPVPDFESAAGSKTAELPVPDFENGHVTAELPAVDLPPQTPGFDPNKTQELTAVDFEKGAGGSGELNGGDLAGGGHNVDRSVAQDASTEALAAEDIETANATTQVNLKAVTNPSAPDQRLIVQCSEENACYDLSTGKRVNPDGTPYSEPTTASGEIATPSEIENANATTQVRGAAGVEEAVGGAEPKIIVQCQDGTCWNLWDGKRVNADGSPYVEPGSVNPKNTTAELPADVNPKNTTAELPAAENPAAVENESRIARAELDTAIDNSRAPVASELEASGEAMGPVETALARETAGAELANVERSAATLVADEGVASVERQALTTAAKDAAASLGRSVWGAITESAPAQFTRELLVPMAAELLEAANPVFMAAMAYDLAKTGAKILGWAGRQIGNIIANPLEQAFKQLDTLDNPDDPQHKKRKRAADDAMIQPSPQAVSLWSPPELTPMHISGSTNAPSPAGAPASSNANSPAKNASSGGNASAGGGPGTHPTSPSSAKGRNPLLPPNAPLGENPPKQPSTANGNSPASGTNTPSSPSPSSNGASSPNHTGPSSTSNGGNANTSASGPSKGQPDTTTASSSGSSAPNSSSTTSGSNANASPNGSKNNSSAANGGANAPRAPPTPLPPTPFGPAPAHPASASAASAPKPGAPPPDARPSPPPANTVVAANTPRRSGPVVTYGPPIASPVVAYPPSTPTPPPSSGPRVSASLCGSNGDEFFSRMDSIPEDMQWSCYCYTHPDAACHEQPTPPDQEARNNTPQPPAPPSSDDDCSGIVGQLNCKVTKPMEGGGSENGGAAPDQPNPGTQPNPPPPPTPNTSGGANSGSNGTPPSPNGTNGAPSGGNSGAPPTPSGTNGGNNPPDTNDGLPPPELPPPPPPKPPAPPSDNSNSTTPPPTTPPVAPPPTPPTPPPPSYPPYEPPAYTPSSGGPTKIEMEDNGPHTIGEAYDKGGLGGALGYAWGKVTGTLDWLGKTIGGS